jgi:tRNA pseudouridine32 synthase / 23S rRNA pseudouridine746 synthase
MARPPRSPTIAMRNGVSPSSLALPSLKRVPWRTVLDALTELLPAVAPDVWAQRMAAGQVLDEQGQPIAAETPYTKGQRVYYWRDLPTEQPIPFQHTVLHQCEHLVVADKPHFLPVTPGGRFVQETLLVRLKHQLNLPDLSPLHRLDRETAGVVAFCVRPQDRDAYQRLFRQRQVHKVYEAVAALQSAQSLNFPLTRTSHLREDPERFYRMQEVPLLQASQLGLSPNSTTHVERLQRLDATGHPNPLALYRLQPVSGKRHQLRVHMAALGLPILHDQFYPVVQKAPGEWEDFATPPLQLLGRELAFTDPVTGAERQFTSQQKLLFT